MYLHPVEMIFWMDILYMVPPILNCPVRDNFTCPVRNAMFFLIMVLRLLFLKFSLDMI